MKEKTKKILAISLMVIPPAVFVLILIAWPIFSLLIGNMIEAGSIQSGANTVRTANLINVIMGFLGILSLAATPIGFVAGLVLLLKRKNSPVQITDNNEQ